MRPPLAGGAAFNYTWDAYDRLRSSTRSGGASVNYTYDAGGRLLKRTSSSGGTTVNYWLGLNKIAEEKWEGSSDDNGVFRPDDEIYATPQEAGWYIFRSAAGGGSMDYVTDSSRGKVLHLNSGSAAANSGVFMIGDSDSNDLKGSGGSNKDNPNAAPWNWGDDAHGHIGLWIKNADPNHAPIRVGALVQVGDSEYNFNFVTDTGTDSNSNGCIYHHLGNNSDTNFNDGQWHYLELDLNAYAQSFLSDSVYVIDGLVIKGANVYVDDIVLSGAALGKTYQLHFGAWINGSLGSWVINWQNQESKFFYHGMDLGMVMANTDKNGHATSICEPDMFGNYRNVSGSRPDTIGLTGKTLDMESGLYYFNARWLDAERGLWISEDLVGFEGGLNLHSFVENNPVNLSDPSGLDPAFSPDIGMGNDTKNMYDHMLEDWDEWFGGNRKGTFSHCFGECLKCHKASDAEGALVSWLGGGAYLPKNWLRLPQYENAGELGSAYHLKIPVIGGLLKKYNNFIKGRPGNFIGKIPGLGKVVGSGGKLIGKAFGVITIAEGVHAARVEIRCAGECAIDPNSY